MPNRSTTNSWLFPPQTREVQLDEKWGFVYQKEQACDPTDPLDRLRGDDWDHTAVDPESRLLLALVLGKRDGKVCERLVQQVHDRTAGRTDLLITSDEHAPYETAIRKVYGVERPRPRRPGPGRPPKPMKVLPEDLCYATVRKRREKGRVVEVVRTLVFGTLVLLQMFLGRSTVSATINTSFVERHNGTDRHQNSRKRRKTYAFSKELEMHRAASYFIGYSYNFCWEVRTLRVRGRDGSWIARTPAIAAGLTDHTWSLAEWMTYPARPG
jgi:IS1 family transposase